MAPTDPTPPPQPEIQPQTTPAPAVPEIDPGDTPEEMPRPDLPGGGDDFRPHDA